MNEDFDAQPIDARVVGKIIVVPREALFNSAVDFVGIAVDAMLGEMHKASDPADADEPIIREGN